MAQRKRYAGIYPILFAFWNAEGRLDREAMRLQVNRCIAAGAHGITVLGLVTECNKMDVNERRQLMEWVAEDIDGRVPYAVTCVEPSIPGQIDFARAAQETGADWVILQPPPVKGMSEKAYVRYFGAIAEKCQLPVAIQNNPINLDIALSNDGLIALGRNHANITILKAEGPAENVARLIAEVGDRFDLFSGRGGLELMSTFLSGCHGCIPAPDVFDVQLKIFDLVQTGDAADLAEADRLYKEILPLIVFMSQTVAATLTYGKYLTARRLGLDNHRMRTPALEPTEFGLRMVDRMTADLGLYGELNGRFTDQRPS